MHGLFLKVMIPVEYVKKLKVMMNMVSGGFNVKEVVKNGSI